LIIALQLAWPVLNFDLPWTNFGRLRPLAHLRGDFRIWRQRSSGNVDVCRAADVPRAHARQDPALVRHPGLQRLHRDRRNRLLLGATQGKEYAEPEWYADLWLTIVWVFYLLLFLGTLWKRKEPHIYVANWFYLAFIVTIAVLHITNNLTIPVSIYAPSP
jgi:cytochrome c oxidase cbb3-type subunit 1